MIYSSIKYRALWALMLCLCAALTVDAQQRGGGGGRTTGGNRTGGNRTGGGQGGGSRGFGQGTSTTPYYPPGEVGEALVTSDPETRSLIVISDDETFAQLTNVVHSLDVPKPQVMIKVVFLEVTYRNASDIGIEGAYHRGFGNSFTGNVSQAFGLSGISQGGGSNAPVANRFGVPINTMQPIPPGAGLYQVLGQDFEATIRAIQTAGKTEVLSRPSILTRNNQQATISLGQEVPLVTNTRFDTLGNQINTVSYQQVGIILRVTPFITPDGLVEMIVSPEISALADRSQWVPVSAGALAPVVNSRMADTVVVVPDAQTVIIGGMMQNARDKTESKIPYLSSIPLLGNLFKHNIKDDSKTELMIFLTPHIVMQPTQLAGLTTQETANAQLAPKSFSEKELNQFLDDLPNKIGGTNAVEEAKPAKKKTK